MYEIIVARTLEPIEVDLSFDDAVELLHFYQDMCGYDVLMVSATSTHFKRKVNYEEEYKSAYVDYFAQLQEMGNIL